MILVFFTLSTSIIINIDSNTSKSFLNININDEIHFDLNNRQAFVFSSFNLNYCINEIWIDEQRVYIPDKYSHCISLYGNKSSIRFKSFTRVVIYILSDFVCDSAIYAFGGRTNTIKFKLLYDNQNVCVFTPTFNNDTVATYSFSKDFHDFISGEFHLRSIDGNNDLITTHSSLKYKTKEHIYGYFKVISSSQYFKFIREYDNSDSSFIDDCINTNIAYMCTNSGCKSNIELFSFKPFSCSNRGDNTILIICVVVIFISLILCCIFSIYGIKCNIFTGGNYKHI